MTVILMRTAKMKGLMLFDVYLSIEEDHQNKAGKSIPNCSWILEGRRRALTPTRYPIKGKFSFRVHVVRPNGTTKKPGCQKIKWYKKKK